MEEKKEKKINGFDDTNCEQQFQNAIKRAKERKKQGIKIEMPQFLKKADKNDKH